MKIQEPITAYLSLQKKIQEPITAYLSLMRKIQELITAYLSLKRKIQEPITAYLSLKRKIQEQITAYLSLKRQIQRQNTPYLSLKSFLVSLGLDGIREYWMIYRGPWFLSPLYGLASPIPLPPIPVSKLSLFLSLPVGRQWRGVRGDKSTARKPASLQIMQYFLGRRVCTFECRQRPNPKSLTGG